MFLLSVFAKVHPIFSLYKILGYLYSSTAGKFDLTDKISPWEGPGKAGSRCGLVWKHMPGTYMVHT